MNEREAKELLILAAAPIVRSEQGKSLLAAFDAYTEVAREACVQAPPEWLHQSQGAARHATMLLKLLKTAPEEAEKIYTARAAKQK